ncbi:hypothetical protein [Rosistilla oblonga]|uniref:hypothetical protein n=1 Tax=Rosistilla oblonga TaxID=2527990 RepID=UPI003A98618E
MPSETSIANIAMRHLGENPISNLDEDSENARLVKKYFNDAKTTGLEEYPWTWAIQRTSLGADSTDPAFGYDYRYMLPADCISVFWVGKDGVELTPLQPWEVEGDYLLCNIVAPIQIKGTCSRTNYARMPQYLAEVIGAQLAVCVAQTRNGSDTSLERMTAIYERAVAMGKKKDSRKQNQETPPANSGFETVMEA